MVYGAASADGPLEVNCEGVQNELLRPAVDATLSGAQAARRAAGPLWQRSCMSILTLLSGWPRLTATTASWFADGCFSFRRAAQRPCFTACFALSNVAPVLERRTPPSDTRRLA